MAVVVLAVLTITGWGAAVGLGAAVLALQHVAQQLGVVTLTVEVDDPVARATFVSGGLEVTAQSMTKAL